MKTTLGFGNKKLWLAMIVSVVALLAVACSSDEDATPTTQLTPATAVPASGAPPVTGTQPATPAEPAPAASAVAKPVALPVGVTPPPARPSDATITMALFEVSEQFGDYQVQTYGARPSEIQMGYFDHLLVHDGTNPLAP